MKRSAALLLALALLLCALPVTAEEAATGDWYAVTDGVPTQLTLNEDGTYAVTNPLSEPVAGTWELADGFVYLDGDRDNPLALNGPVLMLEAAGLYFTRQAPDLYVPAEPAADAPIEAYAGYWQCAYTDVNGTPLPASAAGDYADLYVEGSSAVLGGPLFGDAIVRLTYENGALTCENEGVRVELQYLQDGFLRLTVTGSGTAPQVWYLAAAYSAALDPEAEETP